MESREVQFPDGETVIFIRFSDEEHNLMHENHCYSVRVIENDAACDGYHLHDLGECCPDGCPGVTVTAPAEA